MCGDLQNCHYVRRRSLSCPICPARAANNRLLWQVMTGKAKKKKSERTPSTGTWQLALGTSWLHRRCLPRVSWPFFSVSELAGAGRKKLAIANFRVSRRPGQQPYCMYEQSIRVWSSEDLAFRIDRVCMINARLYLQF